MSDLKKKKVFKYLYDVLKSRNIKVKNMNNYNIIIEQNDFSLDNIQELDNKIIIGSFIKYQDELDKRKDKLKDTYNLQSKGMEKQQLKEFKSIFKKENASEIELIKQIEKNVKRMKSIYNNLFNIYKQDNEIQGFEIIEISHIIKSSSEAIERELISKYVNIEYNNSSLELILHINETFNLEFDMFDNEKLTAYKELTELEKKGKVNGFEFFDDVEKAYKLIKHSISDLEKNDNERKIVTRPLNLKSLIKDYEEIIELIDDDEVLDKNTCDDDIEKEKVNDTTEIFFPNPANLEQKKIVKSLNNGNVAVQGPPGTGKTHTIINIISHLLATGKSVLVVSEKKEALSVIKKKLPNNLQNLVISMLAGDKQTQKETEESLRKIIEMVDQHDEKEMLQKIDFVTTEMINIEKEISRLVNLQINTYIQENKKIIINDKELTASQWMQKINLDNVLIDDCKMNDIIVSAEELNFITMQDKELLNELITYHISTKELVTLDEIKQIEKMCIMLSNTTYESYKNIKINSEPISDELISQELETLLLQWYENENDYQLDYKEYENYIELSEEERKLRRNSIRYDIIVPNNLSRKELVDFLNKLNGSGKVGYLQRLINNKYAEVKVNNISILEDCSNKQIIIDYLRYQEVKEQMLEQEKYFQKILTKDVKLTDIEKIFTFYEEFIENNKHIRETNNLNNNGIDLFKLEKENSDFEMLKTYNEVLKTISYVSKFEKSLKVIENQIDKKEKIFVDYVEFKNDLIANKVDHQKYVEFLNNVAILEDKHFKSNKIIKIKEKMDKMSDSMYLKLINDEITTDILKYWNDNYIFTQISKLGNEDYRKNIINLKNKKMDKTKELIEAKSWLAMINKIGQREKEAMQTWDMLMRKIGKGTGKTAPLNRKKAVIEMKKIQNVIPVWITTRKQVSELFSYNPHQLFDVVIYDESSQSTIEALNVIERGRRKLIVGDHKQISPTIFEKEESVNQIRNNYFSQMEHALISYDTTLFDYANAKYKSIQLKEHFRCLPEIIEYSNQLQYSGSMIPLRVVNEKEKLKPVVEHVYTETGYIDMKKVNIVEAEKIIEIIKEMINNESYINKSIGVISLLGQEQALKINELIISEFSIEIREKYDIKVATSYEFQGDERDIIILSMVSARKEGEDEIKIRALTNEMYRQRFNVAASRAKDKMILVHSILPQNISNKECLRLGMLDFFLGFDERQIRFEQAKVKFDSIFEEEIFKALNNNGYHVIPQYEVNHFKIDLVVEGQSGKIAIECDGEKYHGPEKFEDDMRRQQILERAGWQFYRIRGRHYFSDKEGTINNLLEYLISENILPTHNIE